MWDFCGTLIFAVFFPLTVRFTPNTPTKKKKKEKRPKVEVQTILLTELDYL